MSQNTVHKILDAAIEQFAEKGFEGASVRDITRHAGVNLAAVNYHFGSRDVLVQSVAERYFTPFCKDLERRLDELTARRRVPDADELVENLLLSLLHAVRGNDRDTHIFLALISYAYRRDQQELRDFIVRRYGGTLKRLLGVLRKVMPKASRDEVIWRSHFLLGAVVMPVAHQEVVCNIEEAMAESRSQLTRVLHRLVPVLAAALRAEADIVKRGGEISW